jgi:hypothetical protein
MNIKDVEQTVGDLPKQIVPYMHIKSENQIANRAITITRTRRLPLREEESMTKSRASAEKEVRSWGFGHVFTWSDGP